jgi:site-specific DNA-methyltransferase (adenine-specific)
MTNKRAYRNRTLTISKKEINYYSKKLLTLSSKVSKEILFNKTINQNIFETAEFLPENFIDLMIIDPPYNLDKKFNSNHFKKLSFEEYSKWIENFICKLVPSLKKNASIYFCGDWQSSMSIYFVLSSYFIIRNRLTWEREKGRGAKRNWKNNSEDIWFATVSKDFVFNVNNIKMKKKVLAPYKDKDGNPKDWQDEITGKYRLTHPSNIITDISVPFWSMPENTDHPTQKPEKLIAKLILASSNEGDVVFDPFLGSGTTSVVAKKLNRKFLGVEIDKTYACLAEKRLDLANKNKTIQGYKDKVFWERNSIP